MKTYRIKPLENLNKKELKILESKLNFEFIVKKLYSFYKISTFKELSTIIGVSADLESILSRDNILKDKCKELDLYNHIFSFTEIANFRKNIKIINEQDKPKAAIEYEKIINKQVNENDLLGLNAHGKKIKNKKDIANNKDEAFKILEKIIFTIEQLLNKIDLEEHEKDREYKAAKKRLNAFYVNNILYLDDFQEREIRLWIKRLSLKKKHTSIKDYKPKKNKSKLSLSEQKKLKEKRDILKRIRERQEKENSTRNVSGNNIEDSFTFIKANIAEFNSQSSRNAISSSFINNIKFPLPNATIFFYFEDKIYATLYYSIMNNEIDFLLNQEQTITLDLTDVKNTIGFQLKQYSSSKENVNLILDSLSVLQFMAFYEKDEEKILSTKAEQFIKDINESNLKISPSNNNYHHVIKINTLGSRANISKIGTKRESDGKWLVCGHMRNQRYKDEIKLIWIAPHWRGHGNKKISKTYKIEK